MAKRFNIFLSLGLAFFWLVSSQEKASAQTAVKDTTNKFNVTQKLQAKLDTIAEKNKATKTTNGYRIQVYLGTNKEESLLSKEKLYKIFPNANVYTSYKQPDYKVKFGDYMDRLEVYYVLMGLRNDFPNALIIEEQVFLQK